jgi:hypothetical protein
MYLRETKRQNGDGSVVRYYQLAENEWDKQKGCSVTKVVYNFGRADQLDAEKLKRLASSILRLFPGEEALAAEPDVRVLDSWPYGGVYVLGQLWRELEIDKVLGRGSAFERALFAMTANRALQPYSKLYCHEQWLKEEVFLPEGQDLALHQLYRAMDYLLVHQEKIEKAVRAQDTWRNLVAKLDTVKVVEYTRGAVRVRQTTELRAEVSALLKALGVPLPPRLHAVEESAPVDSKASPA